MLRLFAVLTVVAGVALLAVHPPAASAPVPVQDSCEACHTNPAALQALVRPFPPAPAEGEG